MKLLKLSDFNTLAEAQAYTEIVDTKKIGSGKARGYFVNTNNMWLRFQTIRENTDHPFWSVIDTVMITASDANSYFGMDENLHEGVANRNAIAALVTFEIITQAEADGFISKTNTTTQPFADVTQEQFDLAKALLAIEKQECTYPGSMPYIQTAPNQGVDVEINTDVDCAFSVFLSVCSDKLDPEDLLNYRPVNGDRTITYAVSSVNNRLLIELSSRKMRGYNKLYVKPNAVCNFTAVATTNRG